PHSRSPRALPVASFGVRGLAEQAESIETKWFKEPTDPLLSAREAGPRTELPVAYPLFAFEIDLPALYTTL
ncbi:MAG TPA: hypothetical protein DCZ05_10635, partial [Deltaproteobacteria bacterium]|nr:hypothetical protein [Deltaproteobacteria bacterium]